MRVLHLPDVIGGHPIGLARAERKLGLESSTLALRQHPLMYRADVTFAKSMVGAELSRPALLRYVRRNADVVHFNFGQSVFPSRVAADRGGIVSRFGRRCYNVYASLLEFRDVEMLVRDGIGVVVTFQGDDARCGTDIDRLGHLVDLGYYTRHGDAIKRERIARWSQLTGNIFALNPDLLQTLPTTAEFCPYAHVFPREVQVSGRGKSGTSPLTIVHAPTNRAVKGTDVVVDAVATLSSGRDSFRLNLIEGVPHHVALGEYAKGDLLVDQLHIGWYGGLAVEVMAMGIPVVAFIDEGDLVHIPSEMKRDLPIISSTPEDLVATLNAFSVMSPDERFALGERSRLYVEKWHEPSDIATRMKNVYESAVGG